MELTAAQKAEFEKYRADRREWAERERERKAELRADFDQYVARLKGQFNI